MHWSRLDQSGAGRDGRDLGEGEGDILRVRIQMVETAVILSVVVHRIHAVHAVHAIHSVRHSVHLLRLGLLGRLARLVVA
jgi:hypothetical protein